PSQVTSAGRKAGRREDEAPVDQDPIVGPSGCICRSQLANATASTALSEPTTTRVRGDVCVWATVSSKENDSSDGLTVKLGTLMVCHPSASCTSDTLS